MQDDYEMKKNEAIAYYENMQRFKQIQTILAKTGLALFPILGNCAQ